MLKVTNTNISPFNKVCHLTIRRKKFLKKPFYDSTGFFISRNFILTAAHNIHSQAGSKVISVKIQIGQQGDYQISPTINITIDNGNRHLFIATPNAYSFLKSYSKRIIHDYGLIYIPDELLSDDFQWNQEFEMSSLDISLDGIKASVTGYPAVKDAGFDGNHLYMQQGIISGLGTDVYSHKFDTYRGNSGGPLFMEKNSKNVLLGIHTFGSSGTIVNQRVQRKINDFQERLLNN